MIDEEGNFVDKFGNRVDKNGDYVVEQEPFLDENGKPIILDEEKNEQPTPTTPLPEVVTEEEKSS